VISTSALPQPITFTEPSTLETSTRPVGLSGRLSSTVRWANAGAADNITTAAHTASFLMTPS
jgi:hypothetical protein